MILDELKNVINNLETILLKDSRFKQDYLFKSQVKYIYEQQKIVKPVYNPYLYDPYLVNPIIGMNLPQTGCKKCSECPKVLKCPKCAEVINFPEEGLPEEEMKALLKAEEEGLKMTKEFTNREKYLTLSKNDQDILLKKLDLDDLLKLTKDELSKLLNIPNKYPEWKNLSKEDIKKIIMEK